MRRAIATAVAVSALTFTGCGQSDEDAVKATLSGFAKAVDFDEGKKACSYLDAEWRSRLASQAGSCATVVLSAAPKSAKVTSVEVNGDKARGVLEGADGQRSQFTLEKAGGDWKITDG